MAFPRELREAIPDLHTGRALELDSIDAQSSNTLLFGPARKLAAELNKLADVADQSQPTLI